MENHELIGVDLNGIRLLPDAQDGRNEIHTHL